jgi:MDMPI C-terminal domain
MTTDQNMPDPFEELRSALAEADAERPPESLLRSMLESALRSRPAGRYAHEEPPITAFEAFERSVSSLRSTLASLRPDDWRLETIRGLNVQGLVGHLIGVEAAFASSLTDDPDHDPDADHVASTEALVEAQAGKPGRSTYADWCVASDTTLGLVHSHMTGGALDREFALHGLRMPLDALLIVRSFEVWTHEEDILRVTGRRLGTPDTQTLQLMTDLAFGILPGVFAGAIGGSGGDNWIRFVLTGPGGRTWDWHACGADPLSGSASASASAPQPDAWSLRVVMPAVDFCRLVANRMDPHSAGVHVDGDTKLAAAVFGAASSLALD